MSRIARRLPNGGYVEPPFQWLTTANLCRLAVAIAVTGFLATSIGMAKVDPAALITGFPRLLAWAARAWPPVLTNLDAYLMRGLETIAIATVATLVAALVAYPLSVLVAHNVSPSPMIAYPIRWMVNGCRGIDTIIFALLFVAAVGLGPFAGVLGMIVHSIGIITKLNAEAIETLPSAPLDAAALSGANRTKIVTYAVLPMALPNLASVSLYVWEANVRTSTILGIVGAGGIGTEIKAAIDLFDFQKLFTLSVIVLILVTAIDQLSSWLRRRLI